MKALIARSYGPVEDLALTDIPKGITLNVGLISGGQTVNTVAPSAECQIDLRYVAPPDRAMAIEKIERIVATSNVPPGLMRATMRM